MSSHNSQKYYSSSRRGESTRHGVEDSDNRLPPLRSQLPEFFEQDTLPATYAPRNPSNENDSHRYHSSSLGSTPSPPRSASNNHSSQPPRSAYGRDEPARQQPTGYAYSVHDQTMEPQRTSDHHYFPQRPLRAPAGDPTRRHMCDECGEKFDRPSGLETHMRSHTKERPFMCTHPGCNKAFTVRSNLRRHERTHFADSQFELAEPEPYRNSSTSRPRGGGTSDAAQPSSSSYFSSSRR